MGESSEAGLAARDPAALPSAQQRHLEQRRSHWDAVARQGEQRSWWGSGPYHRRLEEMYRHLVSPGLRVLELGSGPGDLLAAVHPSRGVGIDFSSAMVELAGRRHPDLTFLCQDAATFLLDETFDVVILSDLVNDLWDIQAVLERLRAVTTPRTRIILNSYSRLWELPLRVAEALGLARPVLRQSWVEPSDLENLLQLAGFTVVRRSREVLWPMATPLVAPLCNRFLVKLPLLSHLALTNVVVARPAPEAATRAKPPRVTVVVPARNEAGNVEAIFARTPELGAGTELVFVEGHSSDDTYGAIERAIAANPHRRAKLLRQTGKGKGDAVRLGFAESEGEMLMILDADLTVPSEDLPRFVEALVSGRGEFVNGVRLVYPMEEAAMQFLNLLANKFFGAAFSWLIGQPLKDTLCGTKVLWREDYQRIAANRDYFGQLDPFGDFDLLFGAARQNLDIVDVPVRYRQRTYGTTNIQRFRHGLLLLRMLGLAARRLKFV
jgi:2-polyprenyl-3-methyl-5-hydroxy-6-metoxy-1,4-benzoquinol methylase